MNTQSGRGDGRASGISRVSPLIDTIDTARRGLLVLRVLLGVCSAAIVVAAFIDATTQDPFDGSESSPGKLQVARFLSAISTPLLLVGVVLALSVFASVYIARFELETRRAEESREVPAGPSPLMASRSVLPPNAAAGAPAMDDAQWRPTGS